MLHLPSAYPAKASCVSLSSACLAWSADRRANPQPSPPNRNHNPAICSKPPSRSRIGTHGCTNTRRAIQRCSRPRSDLTIFRLAPSQQERPTMSPKDNAEAAGNGILLLALHGPLRRPASIRLRVCYPTPCHPYTAWQGPAGMPKAPLRGSYGCGAVKRPHTPALVSPCKAS